MAAPDYVPNETAVADRYYVSPPRRPQPWLADRPAELTEGQPMGAGLGVPGPDQGYALRLARRFEDRLVLAPGEQAADVIAGCVGVALKRAALFGRAPVSADLEVAFRIFGFLTLNPDETLVAWRKELFAGVSHPHHYAEARRLVDLASEDILRNPPGDVEVALTAGAALVVPPSDSG